MIGKVGQTNIGNGSKDKLNMMRNPNQLMGKLQQMVDPKTLGQMGGIGNLMGMMK
jgi:signal recognition particle subunit SRP54